MNLHTIHRTAEDLLSASTAADPAAPLDFRKVVEEADVGICITVGDRFAYVNPKFAQMHGWAPHALIGTDFACVVHPDSRAQATEIRRLRDLGRHRAAYEAVSLRRDGSAFDTRIFGRTITYQGTRANLTTVSDISELADAHRVSAWRARMLRSHESLCRSGSIELMPARGEVRLSAGTRTLLQGGDAAGVMSIRSALRAVAAADRARTVAMWRQALPGQPFEFRHRLLRADATELRVVHRGLIEVVDGVSRAIAILHDLTEQYAAREQIERLVNYHPVTGLATRALLLARTAAALDAGLRESRPVAVLCLRVSQVDRVHDALGLHAGDSLESSLATRLLNSCRAVDTCAHLGGGEFVILLDPIAGADAAHALNAATRVLAAVAAVDAGDALAASGEIGIALFPSDAADAGELVEHAQTACGRGGASIAYFTRAAGQSAVRRIQLERGLRRAFERRELQLHYQPQVDLRTGKVVGAEALLRWYSDEFGHVSPAEFVPIAEESGLIVPLGEWVFRAACEQSVRWQRAGLPPLRISVNLSPRQLEEPDISHRLQAIVLETGAEPAYLGIEVTESLLMRDLDSVRRTLTELSAIGIEIALDDFGVGYSNLGVLRALPFDVLKIDRSLVHDVTASTEDVSITRAVLMLARGMKLTVLAEGVETEGQVNLLASNGCHLIQGYFFSKPLPAEAMAQMLNDGTSLPAHLVRQPENTRKLLLVDDDDHVLSSLRRLLRGAGWQILTARSGVEGLARLAEHDVDVIVSDQRMPGMTGAEFLRRAKELYPQTVRLVLSGYTELQTLTDAVNEGAIYKLLTKPWEDDTLRAHVAEAFQRKALADENQRLSAEVRHANLELAQTNERQQQALAQQREQLGLEEVRALNAQDLVENLPTAVIGIDVEGTIVFVNQAARLLMRDSPLLVGFEAGTVLPPDWRRVLLAPDARHHRSHVNGRPCLLSCAAMVERGTSRGHLLSIVPVAEALGELAA